MAFPKAATVAEHSSLPAFFSAAFKGLWLSDSVSSLAIALVLAFIAARPHLAAKPLILLGAILLQSAVANSVAP
jgi:hypothetical protein